MTTSKPPSRLHPVTARARNPPHGRARDPPDADALACRWFTNHLPEIQSRARASTAHAGSPHREEALAEVLGLAYCASVRAARRGVLERMTPYLAVRFATLKYYQGGRVAGANSTDALSEPGQRRHGFSAFSLTPSVEQEQRWRYVTETDRNVCPAEQAAFNLDFQQWLGGFEARDRRIINDLAAGYGTYEVADRVGLSPGRISQLRDRYQRSWQALQGEQYSEP